MPTPNLFTLFAPTTLGRFQLVASTLGLRAVYWPGQKPPISRHKPHVSSLLSPASVAPPRIARLLKTTADQLARYFAGQKVHFTAPLDLSSLSSFARRVLRALSRIPHGRTTTYIQLAKRIGKPTAARAVGTVLARNPIPIIIPCHRVLAGNGSLGGFSAPGGATLKRRLLLMEGNPPRK